MIPNLQFRDTDEEVFRDNWVEYIRRDVEARQRQPPQPPAYPTASPSGGCSCAVCVQHLREHAAPHVCTHSSSPGKSRRVLLVPQRTPVMRLPALPVATSPCLSALLACSRRAQSVPCLRLIHALSVGALQGSDTDTRRRMACELVKGLTSKFKETVTAAISGKG